MTAYSSSPAWAPALARLAHRVVGDLVDRISFAEISGTGRHFIFEAEAGRLLVKATGPNSAAVGLHEYLRRYCGVAVSWDDPRPAPPRDLPDAARTGDVARVQETYYLNFCTFGYTMPWWGWQEWEREIDWMALRGITAPLMLVGHEAVLEQAFLNEGLAPEQVAKFLSGPAYLPWLAMGCLESRGGGPPSGWNPSHRALAGRILARQRELGMRPVLPAFTGHVPYALAPEARERSWAGHRTRLLEPEDPRFRRLAAAVVEIQEQFWGTDHRYAADPFIEMPPVEEDPGYPGRVAAALQAGLSDADPDAEWFLQTWPFSYNNDFWTIDRVRTFLADIPGKLTLLDLWAEAQPQWERFDGFPGRDWIWCALLNFGGRTDPIANLPGAEKAVEQALTSIHPPTGMGLAMEATRTAPIYYERVLDLVWRDAPALDDWLVRWTACRYQMTDTALTARATGVWQELATTVLASGDYWIFPEAFTGLLTNRPPCGALDFRRLANDVLDLIWYNTATLVDAWRSLVEVAEAVPERAGGPLGRDLVEVALAVLPRYAELCFLAAYDEDGVRDQAAADRFFTIFSDLEDLLATRTEYRYEDWERAAVNWAEDEQGRQVLEDNARRLVTVWGDVGDGYLDDYSARLWAGLMTYYRDRWQVWAEYHPLESGQGKQLENELQALEHTFLNEGPRTSGRCGDRGLGKGDSDGDVIAHSRHLLDRYGPAFTTAAEELQTAQQE